MERRLELVTRCVLPLLAACGGSSYGHAPQYQPFGGEAAIVAGARPYDPAQLQRRPADSAGSGLVTFFGVVDGRAPGQGGQALLRLSVRLLEHDNVCARPGDDDSCRVTVSHKDYGVVWALVPLAGEDDVGPDAVGKLSLVRIVGTIGQDVSPADGSPVVRARWYRQWPAHEYVMR